ncbi:MAG: aldo/keto reductase, partial [Candidatus Marinimicrobia bacterium]|nr:aldo/keto reductase [Candidatus Neomarinimicrobiota bacterium]
WCLRRPEVSSVIVGATKPAQLDELLPANELALSREQLDRIDQALTSQPADS